jgi:hypothetical protein
VKWWLFFLTLAVCVGLRQATAVTVADKTVNGLNNGDEGTTTHPHLRCLLEPDRLPDLLAGSLFLSGNLREARVSITCRNTKLVLFHCFLQPFLKGTKDKPTIYVFSIHRDLVQDSDVLIDAYPVDSPLRLHLRTIAVRQRTNRSE